MKWLHDAQAVLCATAPPTHYLLSGTQGLSPDERQEAKPTPAATVLAKGCNQLTDEQRTAIAAVPPTPPADLISGTFATLGASNARPDVVNDDFDAVDQMRARENGVTVATPPGYNQVTDARRTAMAALPAGTGAWALEAITTMKVIAALPPPLRSLHYPERWALGVFQKTDRLRSEACRLTQLSIGSTASGRLVRGLRNASAADPSQSSQITTQP